MSLQQRMNKLAAVARHLGDQDIMAVKADAAYKVWYVHVAGSL